MINLGVIKWEVQLISYKINNKKYLKLLSITKLLYHSLVLLNNNIIK